MAYTARTPAVPLKCYSQCCTAPGARPYSDDFAVPLSVYGKLSAKPIRLRTPWRTLALPAPPAPPSRAPVRLPGLSTVPPSPTTADSDTTSSTCSTVPGPRTPTRTIDCPPRLTIYSNRVGLEPSLPLTRLPHT